MSVGERVALELTELPMDVFELSDSTLMVEALHESCRWSLT